MTVRNTEFGPVPVPVTAANESEMLQEVYRRLVRIHSAIVGRTNDDREIIPWTEMELRGLVQGLGAFRREQRRPTEKSQVDASAPSPV